MKHTTIALLVKTKNRLDSFGNKGESYDAIITRLLDKEPIIGKPEGFDPSKRICHGKPMRKVELTPGKFGYKCGECLTLMVVATVKSESQDRGGYKLKLGVLQ